MVLRQSSDLAGRSKLLDIDFGPRTETYPGLLTSPTVGTAGPSLCTVASGTLTMAAQGPQCHRETAPSGYRSSPRIVRETTEPLKSSARLVSGHSSSGSVKWRSWRLRGCCLAS